MQLEYTALVVSVSGKVLSRDRIKVFVELFSVAVE